MLVSTRKGARLHHLPCLFVLPAFDLRVLSPLLFFSVSLLACLSRMRPRRNDGSRDARVVCACVLSFVCASELAACALRDVQSSGACCLRLVLWLVRSGVWFHPMQNGLPYCWQPVVVVRVCCVSYRTLAFKSSTSASSASIIISFSSMLSRKLLDSSIALCLSA